jgi:hypothetical protein
MGFDADNSMSLLGFDADDSKNLLGDDCYSKCQKDTDTCMKTESKAEVDKCYDTKCAHVNKCFDEAGDDSEKMDKCHESSVKCAEQCSQCEARGNQCYKKCDAEMMKFQPDPNASAAQNKCSEACHNADNKCFDAAGHDSAKEKACNEAGNKCWAECMPAPEKAKFQPDPTATAAQNKCAKKCWNADNACYDSAGDDSAKGQACYEAGNKCWARCMPAPEKAKFQPDPTATAAQNKCAEKCWNADNACYDRAGVDAAKSVACSEAGSKCWDKCTN